MASRISNTGKKKEPTCNQNLDQEARVNFTVKPAQTVFCKPQNFKHINFKILEKMGKRNRHRLKIEIQSTENIDVKTCFFISSLPKKGTILKRYGLSLSCVIISLMSYRHYHEINYHPLAIIKNHQELTYE